MFDLTSLICAAFAKGKCFRLAHIVSPFYLIFAMKLAHSLLRPRFNSDFKAATVRSRNSATKLAKVMKVLQNLNGNDYDKNALVLMYFSTKHSIFPISL